MACKFLVEGSLCRCAAVRGFVVPSLHERERFCLGESPDRCRTYRLRTAHGKQVPEDAYYALWMPTSGGRSVGQPERPYAAAAAGGEEREPSDPAQVLDAFASV